MKVCERLKPVDKFEFRSMYLSIYLSIYLSSSEFGLSELLAAELASCIASGQGARREEESFEMRS